MSVTIIDAWMQDGWTNCDHLLDQDSVKRCIGKTYQSAKAALKAAEEAGDQRSEVAIHYRDDADGGSEWIEGSEPDLPGRKHMLKPA